MSPGEPRLEVGVLTHHTMGIWDQITLCVCWGDPLLQCLLLDMPHYTLEHGGRHPRLLAAMKLKDAYSLDGRL